MASLQEHLVTFRESSAKATDNAKVVLQASLEINEMTIVEWLYRLNLTQYINKFTKNKVKFVQDLKHHSDGNGLGRQF